MAQTKIEQLKLSTAEVKLLKRINQIEEGDKFSSSMLKLTPFAQLAGSPSPEDVAITIATNDWDTIASALGGLKKITNCTIVKEIDLWHDVDGNQYSSPKSESFFTQLRSKANEKC